MGELDERCPTGIKSFDKLCQGGFVRDSINLVTGNAGAGKTTFILQFLYNGAEIGENGLYLSFEPEVQDLYRDAKKHGWDFENLDKKGKCKVLKMSTKSSVKEIGDKLAALIAKYDIRRVCFDPINVFAVSLQDKSDIRQQIFDLVTMLKKISVTVLIAGEADEERENGQTVNDNIVFTKYLVDGVVELYSSGLGGAGDRAIRISKMRGTNHFRGPVEMSIKDNGINISGK